MMKYISVLLLFCAFLLACSGDCASCHQNIDFNDKEHNIMLNCKICHTDEKLSQIQMQSGCGKDCFACHNVQKINRTKNKEHDALNNCISCHISLKNTLRNQLDNNTFLKNNIFKSNNP